MTTAILDAQAPVTSEEAFAAMCDDPDDAIDLYPLYLSRMRWREDTLGA